MKVKVCVSTNPVNNAPSAELNNKPVCTNNGCTMMCGHECGECGRYDPNYREGHCNYYNRDYWPADHPACEHYY